METISVGILCTFVGGIIGFLTFSRNRDKDLKKDGVKDGVLSTKLDYISKGIDEIKAKDEVKSIKIENIDLRVVRVEESTKSAHKRIDDFMCLKEKMKKEGIANE
jgi:hypothetical protein